MGHTEPHNSAVFKVCLIKPSHYDDDGYVIQWVRSFIPSNSLAALYGLVAECAERRVLGPDVAIEISAYDETNTRIDVNGIAREVKQAGAGGLVAFVGVQSNQFPRAMDLARRFRTQGVQVCIGGFHVSGCIAMLPGIQPDLQEAMDLGISLFAGEAEGRIEALLRDAHQGTMQPLYNFMDNLPDLAGAPTPFLPPAKIKRNAVNETTFDAGRGCPFLCSFCTIINVQGRKSRRRSADDIERIIRTNAANGVFEYFVTDDNFARNQSWEGILDRIIALREIEGMPIRLILQVDTMCHKLPNFIDKAARAGVRKVFIGLENINPDSLAGTRKKQNRISEYRGMFQAWRRHGIITFAGYILGFPNDTRESILRDIRIIQRELPVDILEFFYLTPLPGSADHKELFQKDAWMEPDMNNYDLIHPNAEHPRMSRDEWRSVYREAWDTYYSFEHLETLLRRARADGLPVMSVMRSSRAFYCCYTLEKLHPLDGGLVRRKYRRDRRPGMPRELPVVFHLRFALATLDKYLRFAWFMWKYNRIRRRVMRDPDGDSYVDVALTPVSQSEQDSYEMFTGTRAVVPTPAQKRQYELRTQ